MSQTLESSAIKAPAVPSSKGFRRYAGYVFWLLWFTNFLNYVDRYAFAAVLKPVRAEFHLTTFEEGLLATAFLFVYTFSILPLGLLADRIKRKFVVSGGVAFWSLVTAVTAFAPNFAALFATRAALGLGEGSYFPASTSMLASCYPPAKRASVMSRWNTGLLAGAAIGTLGGGLAYEALGQQWRPVFLVFGIPGLLVALLVALVREPPRGAEGEAVNVEAELAREGLRGLWREMTQLMRIRSLRIVVALQALSFFVFGATALFLSQFISDQFGVSVGLAGTITGAVLVIGGIAGLLAGGWISDALVARYPGARVLVSGWGFAISVPCFAISVLSAIFTFGIPSTNVRLYGLFVPFFFLSVALLQVNSGPLTAVSQDVVTPLKRAAAVGLTLMLSHFLGDLFSPSLVGLLSDNLGAHGQQIAFLAQLGVNPQTAFGFALLITCVPILIAAAIVGIWGARFVKGDEEAARA
jgi:MFS family permease